MGRALLVVRRAHGWTWGESERCFEELMPWRWPRLAALMAGVIMLAVAGCVAQRLTGVHFTSVRKCCDQFRAAFGGVDAAFWCRGMPVGCHYLPEARRGGDTADYYDSRRRVVVSRRKLLAGMALSTALYHAAKYRAKAATRGWRKC